MSETAQKPTLPGIQFLLNTSEGNRSFPIKSQRLKGLMTWIAVYLKILPSLYRYHFEKAMTSNAR